MGIDKSMLIDKERYTLDFDKYELVKAVRFKVNQQLIRTYLEKTEIAKAARFFGIVRQGTMVLEDNEEVNTLMDFAIRRQNKGNKPPVEHALADGVFTDEYELEYLRGLTKSFASWYEIKAVYPADGYICMKDRLFMERPELKLYDRNFSQTSNPGFLLYMVIVPMFDIHISSGISYVFSSDKNSLLERECFMRHKNKVIFTDEGKRSKLFFHLNRRLGHDVIFSNSYDENELDAGGNNAGIF